MRCLLCKGKGKIEDPQSWWEKAQDLTKAIKRLRTEGYSYTEIQKLLGLKTKHQVAYHAKKGTPRATKS